MNVLKYGQGTKKVFKKDGRFEIGVDKTLRNEDMTTEAGTLTDVEAAWLSGRVGDRKLGAAHPPPAARCSRPLPAAPGGTGPVRGPRVGAPWEGGPRLSPDVQDEQSGHDGVDPVTEGLHPLLAERLVQVKGEDLHAVSRGLSGACGRPGRVAEPSALWASGGPCRDAQPMLCGPWRQPRSPPGQSHQAPTHKLGSAPASGLAHVGQEDDHGHQQV